MRRRRRGETGCCWSIPTARAAKVWARPFARAASRVETAAGSSEAIHKAGHGDFDLAIIDLDLPAVHGIAEDGWDLVRILRAADPGLLMVLIAAECHPDTQAEALRYGAAHLLEKPISPRELRSIVRTLRPETSPV